MLTTNAVLYHIKGPLRSFIQCLSHVFISVASRKMESKMESPESKSVPRFDNYQAKIVPRDKKLYLSDPILAIIWVSGCAIRRLSGHIHEI